MAQEPSKSPTLHECQSKVTGATHTTPYHYNEVNEQNHADTQDRYSSIFHNNVSFYRKMYLIEQNAHITMTNNNVEDLDHLSVLYDCSLYNHLDLCANSFGMDHHPVYALRAHNAVCLNPTPTALFKGPPTRNLEHPSLSPRTLICVKKVLARPHTAKSH